MLVGTGPVEEFLAHAATLDDFDTESVTAHDAEVLQATYEMRIDGRQVSLPARVATRPIPRHSSRRSGVAATARGARSRWHKRASDRAAGCAHAASCRMRGVTTTPPPKPYGDSGVSRCNGAPSSFAANTTRPTRQSPSATIRCARSPRSILIRSAPTTSRIRRPPTSRTPPRGLRLVQVDIDYTIQRAERVKPRLSHFDGPRWGVHASVIPYHAISASTAVGAITIQRLRYVSKPDELAFTSTEVL
jgi:hypothetical protein